MSNPPERFVGPHQNQVGALDYEIDFFTEFTCEWRMFYTIEVSQKFVVQAPDNHCTIVGSDALRERMRRCAREIAELHEAELVEDSLDFAVKIPFPVDPPQRNLL